MRNLALIMLLIRLTLSGLGCTVSDETREDAPTPVVTRMAALFVGTLVMSDGCLHVSDGHDTNLVVWPPDFEVSIENDTVRLLYEDWVKETERKVEVRLGQMVRLSGGEVKSFDAFDERTREGIPAGCSGPYWLVGGISAVEGSEQSGAPADLVGTEWVLISLHGESLIEDTEITIYFEDAYLGGSMTCNGYGGGPDSGKYSRGDGTLTIPHEIAVTLQLCFEPEGIMEQEATYIKALRKAATFRVVDDRLQIEDASGRTTLVFERKR
ncbi:MAG: META domain-containing protein [Anaerolineae bacterium]|jgi:heat shock protein HslJ